ncbi:MAG: class II fructose-bisphosphate aldolase, partial [Chloroflexi bacterium]|nr:class II fructose-bisphosphate aldolase [Chloroflexota bacterium]
DVDARGRVVADLREHGDLVVGERVKVAGQLPVGDRDGVEQLARPPARLPDRDDKRCQRGQSGDLDGEVLWVGAGVRIAKGRLVGVEDEISVSEREASMTDPSVAADFVERTGVDSLAVSIGNAHGWYKGKPQLDFDRLKSIRDAVDVPLVLHGGSGIPDEDIKRAISLGIAKINIDTEIRDAFKRGVAGFISENPDVFDPRKILTPAIDEMVKVVAGKMRLFGSSGKAREILGNLKRAA